MAPVLVPLEELGEEVVEGEREDDIGYEGVYETPTTWVETEGTWGVACVAAVNGVETVEVAEEVVKDDPEEKAEAAEPEDEDEEE